MKSESGETLDFSGKYFAETTNNNAEYHGLLIGMVMAAKYMTANKITAAELDCYLDSELAVKQMKGEYKISDANIKSIKADLDKAMRSFTAVHFTHVPRAQNKLADKLVNIILDSRLA